MMVDKIKLKTSATPNLSPLLKELGLTQMDLAKLSGVPQGSISRFDKNSRHEADHLFSISRALKVPVDKLFIVEEHESE
jgi:transcriptional regulator with XRE-family HTH domain